MKQTNWRKIGVWVISVALFAYVWSLIPWTELQKVLTLLSLKNLVALFLLDIVIVLTMSGRWWFILRGLGYHVSYLQLSGYRLAAFGVSYFTPGPQFGGEPLQVWVLKSRHNIPTSSALASVTVDKLLELFVNFTILAWGVVAVLQTTLIPSQSAGWLVAVAVSLWLVPVMLLAALAKGYSPLSHTFRWLTNRPLFAKLATLYAEPLRRFDLAICASEGEVSLLCQQAPRSILAAFFASLLTWLLWLTEFWLMYFLLGLKLNFNQLLIVLTAVRIAFLLPLPAGLGTLEASQYVAMQALGQATAIGLSGTVFIRVRDFILGGIGLWLSGRLIQTRTPPTNHNHKGKKAGLKTSRKIVVK